MRYTNRYDYIVTLTGPRDKVFLIKMVRFITDGGGLKECKYVVEESVDFETWMDSEVTFELRCDSSMLALLVVYIHNDHSEFKIIDAVRQDCIRVDMDLTHTDW